MQEINRTIEFDLQIRLGEERFSHFHQEVELLYVLEGSMRTVTGDTAYQMHAEDVVIINANKSHALYPKEDCLYCRIHIPYRLLSDAVNSQTVLFWCNSVLESGESYQELRAILQELINDYVNGRKDRYFYRYSLCYKLLHFITNYYMVTKEDIRVDEKKSRQEDRMEEIMNYIHSNYNRSISLQELADNLYLTKSYLSRYFKKTFGMNFLEYLNNIRIHHATDDLLHTDHTIVQVAMDNGFPNVATFNRLFKEYYQQSPSAYRKDRKTPEKKERDSVSAYQEEKLRERLEQHFQTGKLKEPEEKASEMLCIEAEYGEGEPFTVPWNRVINAGAASELLSHAMREQICLAKEELDFKYLRFWNIFSEELFFAADIEKDILNFERLDSVLDFCLKQKILPFIELGEKPLRIQKTVSRFVVEPENKTIFSSYDEWIKTIEILMKHLLSHYGEERVSDWRFELWDDRREETAYIRPDYSVRFKAARDIIKKYFPGTKIGGAGRHLGWFKAHTTNGIRQWVDSGVYPDFLTYTCYPYSSGEIDREIYSKRKTDENDLKHTIEELKEELLRLGFPEREIYITDWNGTVSDRNYSNDSCWKGAWVLKSCFSVLGKTDVLAYNYLSDLSGQYYDTQGVLNGCRGLITKDRIEKPAMHAFRFLRMLKPWMLQKGEDYLLTTDRSQRIVLVCHNFKERNYLYYVKAEDETGPEEQYRFFDNQDAKRVVFNLDHVENGIYLQKTYTLNREHGSVLDEWMKMDCIRHLRKDDVDYLERMCIPEITLQKFEVTNHRIEREWYMQAHEIKAVEFISIVPISEESL